MSELTGVSTIEVTFWLPEWFPPERLEFSRAIRFPKGHIWEGEVDQMKYDNSAVVALFRLKGVKEAFVAAPHAWVMFEIDANKDIPKQIADIKAKLERFLNRYKEAKGESRCVA